MFTMKIILTAACTNSIIARNISSSSSPVAIYVKNELFTLVGFGVIDLESGDSSVVTCWTVDQEVVGSNPTHVGNLISVVHSLSGFTQSIR